MLRLLNFCVLSFYSLFQVSADTQPPQRTYHLVGVSGGLQDGFPDHQKLDYDSGDGEKNKAILLGRALVRGYKAYLDVMQDGWRQYTPEPGQPLINSVVLASGCHEHANQYWVYMVDSRQVLSVLNNEPRFLSITPDTGLIDLNADETSEHVKSFIRSEIRKQGKTDEDYVALPIVTAVWYHESFLPSPPIYVKEDGTQVTNFPDSLALWAGVNDSDRTAFTLCEKGEPTTPACSHVDEERKRQRYWDGIRQAVRRAEDNRLTKEESMAKGPPFNCIREARFGVGPDTARVNRQFNEIELQEILGEVGDNGLGINFETGELHSLHAEPIRLK